MQPRDPAGVWGAGSAVSHVLLITYSETVSNLQECYQTEQRMSTFALSRVPRCGRLIAFAP